MKTHLTVVYVFSLCLMFAGCQLALTPSSTPTNTLNTNTSDTNIEPAITYWVNYAIPQCATNPWGNNLDPDEITTYYEKTLHVTIYAVEVTPPEAGLMFCQACGCPTGTTVSIQTNAAGRIVLLDNDFTEDDTDITTTTPKVLADDQTSTAATEPIIDNSNTSAVVTVVEDDTVVDEVVNSDTNEELNFSAEDVEMQQRVEQVQSALREYYAQYGSYPNDLLVLQIDIETADFVYTPIGSLPADYYDLVVSYSTSQITLNP